MFRTHRTKTLTPDGMLLSLPRALSEQVRSTLVGIEYSYQVQAGGDLGMSVRLSTGHKFLCEKDVA